MTNNLRYVYVTLVYLLHGGRQLSLEKWIEECLNGGSNFIRHKAVIMKRSTVLYSVCWLVVHIFPTEGIFFVLSFLFFKFYSCKNSFLQANFGYTETEQSRWHHKHTECGGKHQSPIAINTNKVTHAIFQSHKQY